MIKAKAARGGKATRSFLLLAHHQGDCAARQFHLARLALEPRGIMKFSSVILHINWGTCQAKTTATALLSMRTACYSRPWHAPLAEVTWSWAPILQYLRRSHLDDARGLPERKAIGLAAPRQLDSLRQNRERPFTEICRASPAVRLLPSSMKASRFARPPHPSQRVARWKDTLPRYPAHKRCWPSSVLPSRFSMEIVWPVRRHWLVVMAAQYFFVL